MKSGDLVDVNPKYDFKGLLGFNKSVAGFRARVVWLGLRPQISDVDASLTASKRPE